MNPLFAAAAEVQQLCLERGWGFCLIGGLAVLRWGEPRLTRDVDVTILASWGSEASVTDGVLERLTPRIEDAREFALRNRVLLVQAENGVPIDIALGGLDFEERAVERASSWDVGEALLTTCSAEDLIVHKVFAGRTGDWLDVEGIVARQSARLDREQMIAELEPLLELKQSRADLLRVRRILSDAAGLR